jgi:undecaprenyl-diphosphatase
MVDPNTALFLLLYDSLHSQLATLFFSAITWAGHLAFWAAVGLVLVLKDKRRPAIDLLTGALIVIIAVQVIKYGLAVPRPFEVIPGVLPLTHDPIGGEADPSFPSGHAAIVAMGAVIVGSAYPRSRPALVVLVLLVMLSRVYLGLHYPTDVLAGAVLGAAVGWAAVRMQADNKLAERILGR